jgi:glycosyltransferase involved in cell wall biosynthesis
MKILFFTVFYPSVGGMEAMAEILANEWTRLGMQVIVVTRSADDSQRAKREFPYPVIRNPKPAEFLRLMRNTDVFVQNAVALRGIWPLLLARKPLVVRHGAWYGSDLLGRLKQWMTRLATNVAISHGVANQLPAPSTVIYNPYDGQVFRLLGGMTRDRDLIFVGRLVTDKGVDVLLDALALLKSRGSTPSLTIVGDGVERLKLVKRADDLGISAQVKFSGYQEPSEIARLLNQHKVLVVPSRHEPFGNVAVEGIACGCVVIGTIVGGLPEAIGSCGLTFQNENVGELADRISDVFTDVELPQRLLAAAVAHLENRQPRQVAARYLEIIRQASDDFYGTGRPKAARPAKPLQILIHSRFYPSVGGIETVASILAHEWQRLGRRVTVITDVRRPEKTARNFPFPVHYRPGPVRWLRLLREADVFVHMNVSLRRLWPVLLVRRPWVAVHHTCYYISRDGRRDWREKLKIKIIRLAQDNIAVSHYVARQTNLACKVIPNPYDDQVFAPVGSGRRERELVFVGRLVSDKGCEQLIHALGQLRERGLEPRLTVIGDGPERPALEHLAVSLHLQGQIAFTGIQTQGQVAERLRRHEIMIVPSLWEEPFGVAALEGAACGCVVLGSDGGGLPEAIGETGMTFKRGDVNDLTLSLIHLLQHPEVWNRYRAAALTHLKQHQPKQIALQYLEVFQNAVEHFNKK